MTDRNREKNFRLYLEDAVRRARLALDLASEPGNGGCPPERSREVNDTWYAPLEGAGYDTDWANPDFAAEIFGALPGQWLSAFRFDLLESLPKAFQKEKSPFVRFLSTTELLEQEGFGSVEPTLRDHYREPDREAFSGMMRLRFDPGDTRLEDVMLSARPDRTDHLYRYGLRVSPVQREISSFLFSLSDREREEIAGTLAEAYHQGLKDEGLLRHQDRKTVCVHLPMGAEALYLPIRAAFHDLGFLARAASAHRPPVNRQAHYDHRFRYALYLDRDMVETHTAMRREVFQGMDPVLRAYSGVVHVDLFGEKPFSPVPKASMVRPDPTVNALFNDLTQRAVLLQQQHIPRSETSFSMIAFPSPEIGGNFREVFRDCMRVNTLPNRVYGPIQEILIRAMDGAESVRILGAPGNDTDLTVALHPLSDPETETAFENCLASVNIPVGEVFTSPRLMGTHGVLHVREAFLGGLKYENLRMVFRDGETVEGSCTNFDDPRKGADYIRENLFHPHESLPLGEFAVGTNTEAYAMGVRHRIMHLLPVLILEKMGPHFALGDTCYSREEDREHRDPVSGKRLVAVENERTALRGENPSMAYTNRHTDITLPYSDLDSISALHAGGGEVYLMRHGRFVLPGTEVLNEPLEGLDD